MSIHGLKYKVSLRSGVENGITQERMRTMHHHLILQKMIKLALIALLITSCGGVMPRSKTGYVEVDGINVYYEV